jgi:hypothetical protein
MEHTIKVPESIFQRARVKAQEEDVAVDQVVHDLLSRWIVGEIRLPAEKRSREDLIALARAARGMWADRHPDHYLTASRAGLSKRDEELEHARLDA